MVNKYFFSVFVVEYTHFDLNQMIWSRRKGYWGSYNRAFYNEAFEASGAANITQQHGDYFSYKDTARAKVGL